jgi:hypothetical protein
MPEFAHLRAHVYRAIKGGQDADGGTAVGATAGAAADRDEQRVA